MRENVLTTDDLIWPLFVMDGTKARTPVQSMPDVERLSVDEVAREAVRAAQLSIPCIALFPYTDPKLRDETGSEALNPDNLVCRAIRAIKKEVPEIGVLCDVALDPFTSHDLLGVRSIACLDSHVELGAFRGHIQKQPPVIDLENIGAQRPKACRDDPKDSRPVRNGQSE